MAIAWRKEMSVDGGAIDDDHRVLIDIINEFTEADVIESGLVLLHNILDELDDYAKVHFAREERLQAAVLYPFRDAHHREHQELIRRLADLRAMLGTAATGHHPFQPIQMKVAALLHDWLVDHIIKSDLRMAPYAGAMAIHPLTLDPILRRASKR